MLEYPFYVGQVRTVTNLPVGFRFNANLLLSYCRFVSIDVITLPVA